MSPSHRVVVIAGSFEGVDALARLINQLPSTFPIPVVIHLQGQQNGSIARIKGSKNIDPARPDIVHAKEGDSVRAGCIYVISADHNLVFTDLDTLGTGMRSTKSTADELFESAALWYNSGVIGVVLSGQGTDGTSGLRAIANAKGVCVVQSPTEATFCDMPFHALLSEDVQYSVLLDDMGVLLEALAAEPQSVGAMSQGLHAATPLQGPMLENSSTHSLDRAVVDMVGVIRAELDMDIVFVSKQAGDEVVVTRATLSPHVNIEETCHPTEQTLCQCVLEGHQPGVIPSVSSLRLTHDVPITPLTRGTYMAAPVQLQAGTLYGILCCPILSESPEVDQRHFQRLQMSARQVARLVNEAGEK